MMIEFMKYNTTIKPSYGLTLQNNKQTNRIINSPQLIFPVNFNHHPKDSFHLQTTSITIDPNEVFQHALIHW